MLRRSLAGLPPLATGVVMTVTIPARNEEAEIDRTLGALAAQRGAPPFDVVLLANNCVDRTVERALSAGRSFPAKRFHVVTTALDDTVSNVGMARKMLMDSAAARFRAAGSPRGIVATTDADTMVAPDWVERTCEEMERADAVAGCVEVRDDDRRSMSGSMRDLYARELLHRRLWAELEVLIDPVPEDPLPRHSAFVGASIAVAAEIYERTGGLRAIPALEDRALLASLRRIDARVRHSLRVRAWTSGRTSSRVSGGFATFISHLHERACECAAHDVCDPRDVVQDIECRAALRRLWNGRATASDGDTVYETIGIASREILRSVDASTPFGEFYERVIALAPEPYSRAPIAVDDAIAAVEREIASRRLVPARSA